MIGSVNISNGNEEAIIEFDNYVSNSIITDENDNEMMVLKLPIGTKYNRIWCL